jgi:hypothetical protein
MKTRHTTNYLMTQCTNQQILTSTKRYDFDPLLTSLMLQASYKLRATAAKMRSLCVQRSIKLCERIKIWQETTVPQSLLKSWRSQAPIAVKQLMNLFCGGRVFRGISMYSMATSQEVSVAAQKYGRDSTHPICREVGTTGFTGSPISCGNTNAKFHSSLLAQSMRQKSSLMPNLAMNIFALFSASANAWIIRIRHLPIWSIAPAGAVFSVVLLTNVRTPLFLRHK